jgi:hypothetical protein
MDDKTDELRDIFTEVTGEETVTESQREGRGSLTDVDDEAVDERLRAVVERMRDRYDFHTGLDDDALVRLVRAVYDGDDDEAIADALDTDPGTVFEARMDLHLLTDTDIDFPFSLAAVRRRLSTDDETADLDAGAVAAELDADPETVERAIRVARTQARIRAVSGRFRSEFEDAIPEAALAVTLTDAARDDGLDEAAEDIETNTKF